MSATAPPGALSLHDTSLIADQQAQPYITPTETTSQPIPEKSPFDDDDQDIEGRFTQAGDDQLDSTEPPRLDKGKGRVRDYDPTRSHRTNSTLEGDISMMSGPKDMYLSPHTAEPKRTKPQSQPNHHQRRLSQKSRANQRDTRWDLDTMEPIKTPVIDSQGDRGDYYEPRWNTSRDGRKVIHDEEMGGGGFQGRMGSGDYPMANVEQEEEKRIQDVSPPSLRIAKVDWTDVSFLDRSLVRTCHH
jgi:hypothetical protein